MAVEMFKVDGVSTKSELVNPNHVQAMLEAGWVFDASEQVEENKPKPKRQRTKADD